MYFNAHILEPIATEPLHSCYADHLATLSRRNISICDHVCTCYILVEKYPINTSTSLRPCRK